MANARLGNTIYMDTAGQISTDSNIKVIHIIYTGNTLHSQAVLGEDMTSATKKIVVSFDTAYSTTHLAFRDQPLVFANGIALQSISSGSSITIVTSQSGGA